MRKDKNVFTSINHRISTDFAPTSIQTEGDDNDGDDDDGGVWINYNILATAPLPSPSNAAFP